MKASWWTRLNLVLEKSYVFSSINFAGWEPLLQPIYLTEYFLNLVELDWLHFRSFVLEPKPKQHAGFRLADEAETESMLKTLQNALYEKKLHL